MGGRRGRYAGCARKRNCQSIALNGPQEQCYDNIRISKNAWDTNLVKVRLINGDREKARLIVSQANPKYISVNWEAGGGGAFAVIPLNETGRLPEHVPLFRGHTAVVLDTDWYAQTEAISFLMIANGRAGAHSTTPS